MRLVEASSVLAAKHDLNMHFEDTFPMHPSAATTCYIKHEPKGKI
jgi:hypothetical protein